MTFSSLVGERLKAQRQALKLSQAEVADRLGITREHWGRCERGVAVPGGEVLAALAGLGVDITYVLTGGVGAGAERQSQLSIDEIELLELFRQAPLTAKAAAIGALTGSVNTSPPPQATVIKQVHRAPGGIQVAEAGKVTIKKGR